MDFVAAFCCSWQMFGSGKGFGGCWDWIPQYLSLMILWSRHEQAMTFNCSLFGGECLKTWGMVLRVKHSAGYLRIWRFLQWELSPRHFMGLYI